MGRHRWRGKGLSAVLRALLRCMLSIMSSPLKSMLLTLGLPLLFDTLMTIIAVTSAIGHSARLLRRIMPHAQSCSLRARRVLVLLPNTASSSPLLVQWRKDSPAAAFYSFYDDRRRWTQADLLLC